MKLRNYFSASALVLGLGAAASATAETTLLNVSYDPTRELYKAYDAAFAARVGKRLVGELVAAGGHADNLNLQIRLLAE